MGSRLGDTKTTQQEGHGASLHQSSNSTHMLFLLFLVLTPFSYHPEVGKHSGIIARWTAPNTTSVSSHWGHGSLECSHDGVFLEMFTKWILGTWYQGVHKRSQGNVLTRITYPRRTLHSRWGCLMQGEVGLAFPRNRTLFTHMDTHLLYPESLSALVNFHNFESMDATNLQKSCENPFFLVYSSTLYLLDFCSSFVNFEEHLLILTFFFSQHLPCSVRGAERYYHIGHAYIPDRKWVTPHKKPAVN